MRTAIAAAVLKATQTSASATVARVTDEHLLRCIVKLHRGVIVASAAIDHIERDLFGRLRIHLRGRSDVLPVCPACVGLFKQT